MNLRDLFGVGTKLHKIYTRTTAKSVALFYWNMGFVNRVDQDVAKYWYPNETMVVVPICLNGRCCYSGCVSIVSC